MSYAVILLLTHENETQKLSKHADILPDIYNLT